MKELVIDVSHCDPDINLAEWKARRNIYGVIIKAGGYENLGNGGPEQFETRIYKTHLANAQALGLHIGAYFYDVCRDVTTARRNADYFASLLDKYGARFDLPAYMDVEDPRQLALPKRQLTDLALAFIRRMREHGYNAGLYTSRSVINDQMYGSELEPYPLWIAEYSDRCRTDLAHGMWQFGAMNIDGDVYWGDKSGYVDANWCYVDYTGGKPSDEGGSMAKLSYGMASAEVMDHFIDHDAHGYSQIHRDGTSDVETITLTDGTNVSFQGGDRDCSRLVQTCYVVVGALPRGMHMWTGNERETLLDNGFVEVSLDDLERGDVLLRQGHTEMYMGDDVQGGARRSEYHSIDGETGDQDGEEITRSEYDRWEWESAYRCVKTRPGEGTQPTPKPKQDAGSPVNDFGLTYQVHVQDVGWCEPVRDGQTAGTVGYGKRLEALRFTAIPDGWAISAKAHVQNHGWIDYGVIAPDTIIGSTGKSQAIEMLILDAKAPSGDGRHLYYRVHQANQGWKSVTPQGYASGTDGMGIQLEAVRVWLA